MKYVFFEIEEWQKRLILNSFQDQGHEIIFESAPLNPTTVDAFPDAIMVSTFIHSEVTKAVIDKLPNLKLIATRSTGFDHIDHVYAKQNQVYVANVPYYGENTVAEHTFALILALSRKIFQTYERTEKLDFSRDDSIQGFDLRDKTIGIYGMGHIGYFVAKIAQGFGMQILAYKRTLDPQMQQEFNLSWATDIDDLISRSDVITFHCPMAPENHHLISKDNYQKIKRGAVVINTSRGGLIDTAAILLALEEGYLQGAGLDVFEEEKALEDPVALLRDDFRDKHNLEEILKEHLLVSRNDVILTPHNAYNSKEAVHRILDTTLENIHKFFIGNSQNIINKTW